MEIEERIRELDNEMGSVRQILNDNIEVIENILKWQMQMNQWSKKVEEFMRRNEDQTQLGKPRISTTDIIPIIHTDEFKKILSEIETDADGTAKWDGTKHHKNMIQCPDCRGMGGFSSNDGFYTECGTCDGKGELPLECA